MALPKIIISWLFIKCALGLDSESAELNKLDNVPLYETIIFSDIADILNEVDNNANTPLEAIINSESESSENVGDLLAEYQNYLDKAHKQRVNYLEKTKLKNKIPMVRHDRFTKSKPINNVKNNDFNYYHSIKGDVTKSSYSNPQDFFIPINTNSNTHLSNLNFITKQSDFNKKQFMSDKFNSDEKKMFEFPAFYKKPLVDPTSSLCYCKSNKLPCECACKQCIFPMNMNVDPYAKYYAMMKSLYNNNVNTEKLQEPADKVVDIRLKIDIQLPNLKNNCKNHSNVPPSEDKSREVFATNFNLPYSYFNLPVPLELFGNTKPYDKYDYGSTKKLTIHKKKKSRQNNSSKKHRKKIITFKNYNIKIDPNHQLLSDFDESYNNTDKSTININKTLIETNKTAVDSLNDFINNKVNESLHQNSNKSKENVFLLINNFTTKETTTEDIHRNIIENDKIAKLENNLTNLVPLTLYRIKRDVMSNRNDSSLTVISLPKIKATKKLPEGGHIKRNNKKDVLVDSELLYWPNITKDSSKVKNKNITSIILEIENKKAKVNISSDSFRNNHSHALQLAVFGNVDWNDVGTVAPVFISFVGKYVKGMLSFCSDKICHSMKCAEKLCVHRTCSPEDRYNQRGHCTGNNTNESVVSMESIMDLPSNSAFEIVEILHEKLQGNLYGKITLCVSTKCSTFITSKKSFLKSKCIVKDLDTMGHCANVKSVKVM